MSICDGDFCEGRSSRRRYCAETIFVTAVKGYSYYGIAGTAGDKELGHTCEVQRQQAFATAREEHFRDSATSLHLGNPCFLESMTA